MGGGGGGEGWNRIDPTFFAFLRTVEKNEKHYFEGTRGSFDYRTKRTIKIAIIYAN